MSEREKYPKTEPRPAGSTPRELGDDALKAVSGGVKQPMPTTIPLSNGDEAGTAKGVGSGKARR